MSKRLEGPIIRNGVNGEVVSKIKPEDAEKLKKIAGLFNGGEKRDIVPDIVSETKPEEPSVEADSEVIPEEEDKKKGRETKKRVKQPRGSEEVLSGKPRKKPKKATESIRTAEVKEISEENEPTVIPDIAKEALEEVEEKRPESVQETVAEKKEESVIDLSELSQDKMRQEIRKLNFIELTLAVKNYIAKISQQLEKLDSIQKEKERYRMKDIGNTMLRKIASAYDLAEKTGRLNDEKVMKIYNELKVTEENLKTLYDKINPQKEEELPSIDDSLKELAKNIPNEISPGEPATKDVRPERKSPNKQRLSLEEKWEEDFSTYSAWALETERENINLQIENLNKVLESGEGNANDKELIGKQIKAINKKREIINRILSEKKATTESAPKKEEEILIGTEKVLTGGETLSQKIERKKQEIEQAETRASIYRPVGGLFREKPVVRDLGYYGSVSELERLKDELKILEKLRTEEQLGPKKEELEKLEMTHRIYGPAGWHKKPVVRDLNYYDREKQIAGLRTDIKKLGKITSEERTNAPEEIKEVIVEPAEETRKNKKGFLKRKFPNIFDRKRRIKKLWIE